MARGWQKLADNLGRLAQIPSRIARPIATRINVEIQNQFADGKDPYGKAWAPLKPSTVRSKGGDTRILIRTGRGRQETIAIPMSGAGIELVSVDYLGYHMGATSVRPARPVLPNRSDLPAKWQEIIQDEWRKAFGRTMNA